MKLELSEARSSLWLKLRDHMQGLLDAQRLKNDGALDPIQTAHLRGKVAMLKNLLELDKPEPTHSAEHGED